MVAGVQYYLRDSNTCVSLCPNTTYTKLTPNPICDGCNSNCATCLGTATYCTSCTTGRLIINQNTCGSCPNGQFNSATANLCSLCSPNCLTCSAYDTCTGCPFNTMGVQTFKHSDSKCYDVCPSGFYGVISSK